MKAKIFLLLVILIGIAVGLNLFNKYRISCAIRSEKAKAMAENKQSLISNIKAVENDKKYIQLQDVTDFKWDTVYQFGPLTYDDVCDEIVGRQLDVPYSFKDENDGGCILFISDNEAVCYIGTEDNGINISLFSNSYGENAVSYKYEDLKTLCITNSCDIRIPSNKELHKLKTENGNFQFSSGTAYFVSGGFGQKIEVAAEDFSLPRGFLLDFEEKTSEPVFHINKDYSVSDLQYNNMTIKAADAKDMEIIIDADTSIIELNLYSPKENIAVIADDLYYQCEPVNQSNGIYSYCKKITLNDIGKHKISFGEDDLYLSRLWCYN